MGGKSQPWLEQKRNNCLEFYLSNEPRLTPYGRLKSVPGKMFCLDQKSLDQTQTFPHSRHNSNHISFQCRLCMDLTYLIIDSTQFEVCVWSELFGNVDESILSEMPVAIGKAIDLGMFVDSDHVGNKLTYITYCILYTPQYCTYQLAF